MGHPLVGEWRRAGQKLIQQHAQRVDVAPRVDILVVQLGLLGRHVLQRAHHRPETRVHRALGEPLAGRLGHAEIDDLGDRPAVIGRDQDVRRLDVAVDDPLLVGVLDRLADRQEQLQPLAEG